VYSARLLGQALAVCLSATLAFSPTAQVQSPSRSRPDTPAPVRVWHQEAGQYRLAAELPVVAQVRAIVDRAIRIGSPNLPSSRTAQRALSETFGTRMTETAAPAQYVWMRIEGVWVLVCLTVAEFQIDFGRWGHVVVQTMDEMPVD